MVQKTKGCINRLSVLCVLCAVLFLGSCVSSVEQEKESDYFYKIGTTYMNEGKVQMAFVQFQKALQLDPDNKNALNGLGLVYFQLEEFEKAKELFLKTVYIDRDFSDAYNNLGVTCMKIRQWSEAIEAFNKALANPLYPNAERAFYNRGVAYYRTGRYEPAMNEFKFSIKRATSFPLPYYALSLTYNKMGKYGDAAAVITRAIEIDPAYKGDRNKFTEEIKQKLITTSGEEEADLRDYLEILRY